LDKETPVNEATAKEAGISISEFRLWFVMLGGAPAIPIALFWMGWTHFVKYCL
jgi:hypothetical protein